MNITSILNGTLPLPLHGKENDATDKSFMNVLTQNIAESFEPQAASAYEEAQPADDTVSENKPSYSLTDEQLDYLASKYDLDNIKPNSQEEHDLLNELAEMGIIPREDASHLFLNCGFLPTDEFPFARIVPVEEASSSLFSSCYVPPASDKLIDRLIAIIETQKNISEYYKSNGDDFASERSDSFTGGKQNILDVLQSISERASLNPSDNITNRFVYNIDGNGNVIMPYSVEDIEAMRRYEAVKEAVKNGEVTDLAEKYNMQTVEVHESEDIDWDNITILTREQVEEMLSQKGHYLFEPTGDPKKDKIIELTLLYRKSCVDYTHSAEFDKLTGEMDLTGLSNAEKYKAIYEKYKYCYGENFTDTAAVNYPSFTEYGTQLHIYFQFEDEVNKACGGAAAAQKARIEALYGDGLKASEVRQMIIDKYYYEGMTLRDLLKMTNEMRLCGADGGITNLLDPLSNTPGTYFVNESTDQYEQITNRESILDKPVSKEFMRKMYNSFKTRVTVHPDLPGIVGMLMDLFNVSEIEGGFKADDGALANVWDKFK